MTGHQSHVTVTLCLTFLTLVVLTLGVESQGREGSQGVVLSRLREKGVMEESKELDDDLCRECVSLIGLMQQAVRAGLGYEDLKNESMAVCYLFVASEDYNPDTLCDLALDTYGPHVVYALNTTERNARYICQFYNYCTDRQDISSSVYDNIRKGGASKNVEQEAGTVARQPVDSRFSQPIKLLHITDMHVDPEYDVGAPTQCDMPLCCRAEYHGTGSAQYWGDYPCNCPVRTVDHILNFIQNNLHPDVIVYTGDTVQHTVWDQPQELTLSISQFLTGRLAFFFPGIPAFYSLGNHDMTPTNLYSHHNPNIPELNSVVFDHWKTLSGFTDEQRETFDKGLYFTATALPGLRVLSYNSEFGSLDNFYSVLNYDEPDYGEMLQWMEDSLSEARGNGEKVIMLGHHPTGGSSKVPGYNRFITDLCSRYGDVIILHLLGHNHDDKFSLVRDPDTGEPRSVMISSPAMTSYTNTNPSIRVFYLDPVTFLPLDMETYHLDIAKDANTGSPPITLSYKTSVDYNMPDASAQSFSDFVDRMEQDDELLKAFRFNMETQTGFEGNCDEGCKKRLLCDLRNADYEPRAECNAASQPPGGETTVQSIGL